MFDWVFGVTGQVVLEAHSEPVAEFLEQANFASSGDDLLGSLCRAYQGRTEALNTSDLVLLWHSRTGMASMAKIVYRPKSQEPYGQIPDHATAFGASGLYISTLNILR